MIERLIELGWKEGNECYFKTFGDDIWYYNIEANTFSIEENCCGVEQYICEGSIDNLEKIENEML